MLTNTLHSFGAWYRYVMGYKLVFKHSQSEELARARLQRRTFYSGCHENYSNYFGESRSVLKNYAGDSQNKSAEEGGGLEN